MDLIGPTCWKMMLRASPTVQVNDKDPGPTVEEKTNENYKAFTQFTVVNTQLPTNNSNQHTKDSPLPRVWVAKRCTPQVALSLPEFAKDDVPVLKVRLHPSAPALSKVDEIC